MTINRSTLATIYQAFADYITDMSIDPERLFTEAGLDFKRINDPEARFGTSEINQLWHLAKRETKKPLSGCRGGQTRETFYAPRGWPCLGDQPNTTGCISTLWTFA